MPRSFSGRKISVPSENINTQLRITAQEKESNTVTAILIEIIILAIIQGLTEWLPISSSGHLVLAQKYMSLSLPVFLDVTLHVGSLVVVLTVFRKEILRILKALAHLDIKSDEGKLGLLIVVGSVPTGIIGFIFRAAFESLFNNAVAVGFALLVTGVILFVSKHVKNKSRELDFLDSILIGVAQGIALIPGISRSGVTISAGLLRRIDKQAAFAFSFLLFIPAVTGATILTAGEAPSLATSDLDYVSLALGLVITVVVGYLSLRLLRFIVLKGRLHWFAYYCWAVGLIVIIAQVV